MTFKLLLCALFLTFKIQAQELNLFSLSPTKQADKVFVSLSDIYPLSEHPDSLAIPDLSEKDAEQAKQYEYFKLDSTYRQRFLTKTKILETDKVYLCEYSKNKLASFSVRSLTVVACLNIYGAEWPFSQQDFRIGFEIDKGLLTQFERDFTNCFVSIGKNNPFILSALKPIIWQKIDSKDLPSKKPISYDTSYAGVCVPSDAYTYTRKNLLYSVQDFVRLSDKSIAVKYLLVINQKTKKTVCEKVYYAGESALFAPLDNQWTGKLFKNKSAVIFGFHWVSFGCPSITFLNLSEKELPINCDNRH